MAGSRGKLFVGCLPYSKTQEDIYKVFSQFGFVKEVSVHKNPDGSPKGAAFVVYQQPEDAMQAMGCMQGYLFEGSNRGITVSLAKSKPPGGGMGQVHVGLPGNPPPPPGNPRMQSLPMALQDAMWQYSGGYDYGGGGGNGWGSGGKSWGKGWQGGSNSRPAFQGGGASSGGSKLFIGQLPYSTTEEELWQLFAGVGSVSEVVLLKDKAGQPKGAAFVRYQMPQHAAAAISNLDGYFFPGSPRPISVAMAQNEAPAAGSMSMVPYGLGAGASAGKRPREEQLHEEGTKLFVGQLPYSRSEVDLHSLFSPYGTVADVIMLKDFQGKSKGAAFVRFAYPAQAQMAMTALNGYLFEGSPRPISVNIATNEKRRRLE